MAGIDSRFVLGILRAMTGDRSPMSPNLTLSSPKCRHCGRYWRPAPGVMSTHDYCNRCSKERRAVSSGVFEAKVLTDADIVGGYLLPRRLRAI